MLELALVQEAMNHRAVTAARPAGATSAAPGPQVGWIQIRQRGPMLRLFQTEAGRYFYWSVLAARFIPIAADRLPEIHQL